MRSVKRFEFRVFRRALSRVAVSTDKTMEPRHPQRRRTERSFDLFASGVEDDRAKAQCDPIWKCVACDLQGEINNLRHLSITVLRNAYDSNAPIKAFYQRLLANGKPKKLALVAAMRKLLTILNTLIKRNELWIDPSRCNQKSECSLR